MSYKCSKCEKIFDQKYEFCPYCGSKLNYPESQPQERNQEAVVIQDAVQKQPLPSKIGQVMTVIGHCCPFVTEFLMSLLGIISCATALNTIDLTVSNSIASAIPYILYIMPLCGLGFSIAGVCLKGKKPFAVIGIVLNCILIFAAIIVLIVQLANY